MSAVLPPPLSDQFEALGVLGSGAFATVLAVRDRALDRVVALKLLRRTDKESRRRFLLEASVLAEVEDPHVVRVYDSGAAGETPYLVMELLEGVTLEKLPEGVDLAPVMAGVARGLDRIHRAGLVHRDLKPQNVIYTRDGRAVLLDLGLVRGRTDRTRLTREGTLVGTLQFLPPEGLLGRRATPAADWYAFGVLAYRLIEGRMPYDEDALLGAVDGRPLPPLEFANLDPAGPEAGVLRDLTAADPAARYPDAGDFRRVFGLPLPRSLWRDGRPPADAEAEPADRPAAGGPGGAPPPGPAAAADLAGEDSAGFARLGASRGLPLAGGTPAAGGRRRPLGVLVAAAGLAGLAAVGLGLAGRGAAPDPPPAPPGVAASETDPPGAAVAKRDFIAAIGRLIRDHRKPGGELDEALRGGGYDAHLAEVCHAYVDPRLPQRWKRVFAALRAYEAALERSPARRARIDALLDEHAFLPVRHLARDNGMLNLVRIGSSFAGQVLPRPVQDMRAEDLDRLRARTREVTAAVRDGIAAVGSLRDPPTATTRAVRDVLTGAFIQGNREALIRESLAAATAADGDLASRWRSWSTVLVLIPSNFEGANASCATREEAQLAAEDFLRRRGAELPVADRVNAASMAIYRWFSVFSTCHREDPGPQLPRLEPLFEIVERDWRANPAVAVQALRWAAQIEGGMLLFGYSNPITDPAFRRIQRFLKRADPDSKYN